MAFLTHLYLSCFLLAVSLPFLLCQQCQVAPTSEEVIRREVRVVLENLTQQVNCLKDRLERIHALGSEVYPAASCSNLLQQVPATPSGYYWVRASNGSAVRVYCDMTRSCGGVTGGWMRVAYLDMTDPSQQCPSPWVVTNSPGRSCSAVNNINCPGRNFLASGVTYSRVCGRAIGYATGSLDAFANFVYGANINGPYLDGISVTHGRPRRHIWSFAGGHGRAIGGTFRCPCDNSNPSFAPFPPYYVGDNYFCDGEYNGALWDGIGCTTSCCTFHSPPWFSVTLPTPTSDDIEVRICADQASENEDINLRLLELYVL